MKQNFYNSINDQITTITQNKLLKHEHIINTAQSPNITLANGDQ